VTDDLSLTLVEKALSVRLAVQLGDRMSARTALAEVHRLVPRLRMEIQQMKDVDDDHEPRELSELSAATGKNDVKTIRRDLSGVGNAHTSGVPNGTPPPGAGRLLDTRYPPPSGRLADDR